MKVNGHDDGGWARLVETVNRIDHRTQAQEKNAEAMQKELKEINSHTGVVAAFISDLGAGNLELSKLAAGKNQVPVSVFVVLLVLCGAYLISNNLKDSKKTLRIPWIGLEIGNGYDAAPE